MAEERTLTWQYNDQYKEAMVVLVGYVTPKNEEPVGTPVFEVEYAIPKPAVKPPGGASGGAPATATTKIAQTQKLGIAFFAAVNKTDACVGALYGGFEQLYFVGTIDVRVSWKTASGKDFIAKASIPAQDVVNKSTQVTVSQVPAELTETLVSATQSDEEGTTTTAYAAKLADAEREKIVGDILVHLEAALERGTGSLWRRVDKACCEPNGIKALRDHDFSTSGLGREQLLECWAQHATELLIGGPYLGTATNMGVPEATGLSGSHAQDAYLAQACVSGTRLGVPLMFQCQQLATMTLLCLGLTTLAEDPLDSHNVKHGNLPGKTTATTSAELADWTDGGWPSAKKAVDRKLARVGTCYYVVGDSGTPGDPNDDYPHVAAVLRVGRTPPRLQLLDTTGWIDDSKNRLKAKSGGGGYMYDTAWVQALRKPPITKTDGTVINFAFKGVMQPPAIADSDLVKAIESMRGARMLGAVRLVVKERTTGDVWWVSQLLPMERNAKPYSLARLMAALRGCPHRNGMEVTWQVIMPSSVAAEQAVWRNKPDQLTTCAAKNCLEGQDRWWATGTLFAVASISVTTDGKPFFAWKAGKNATGAFPLRRATDASPFTMDAAALAQLRKATGWSKLVDMTSQNGRVGPYFKGS